MFSILFQSKEMRLVNRSRALVELSKLVLTYYFSQHISQLYPELSSDQSMGKSVYWVNEMYGYKPSELHQAMNQEAELSQLLTIMEISKNELNYLIVNGIRIKRSSDLSYAEQVAWSNDFFSTKILKKIGHQFLDLPDLDAYTKNLRSFMHLSLNDHHRQNVYHWMKISSWKKYYQFAHST